MRKKGIVGIGVSYPVIMCLGTENMGVRVNPPRSGGEGSSLPGTLHVATAWIGKVSEMVLPSSFLHVPAFSAQGLLLYKGQQLPRARAETQPSCTEKGILPFFVMHKMTFRYLYPHGSHLILHAC